MQGGSRVDWNAKKAFVAFVRGMEMCVVLVSLRILSPHPWGASIENAAIFFCENEIHSFVHGLASETLAYRTIATKMREDLRDAMGIVHSKVLGGANPHGSGRGILQVGMGAYRYVLLFRNECRQEQSVSRIHM